MLKEILKGEENYYFSEVDISPVAIFLRSFLLEYPLFILRIPQITKAVTPPITPIVKNTLTISGMNTGAILSIPITMDSHTFLNVWFDILLNYSDTFRISDVYQLLFFIFLKN